MFLYQYWKIKFKIRRVLKKTMQEERPPMNLTKVQIKSIYKDVYLKVIVFPSYIKLIEQSETYSEHRINKIEQLFDFEIKRACKQYL